MLGMMKYDATENLKRINVPVLVVPGDADPLCPLEASEFMHANLPNSELLPLTPAKHLGLMEHHEYYAKHLRGFVSKCAQGKQQKPQRNKQPVIATSH